MELFATIFSIFLLIASIYIVWVVFKGFILLNIEWDEITMVCDYNLLVIFKEYATGEEDIKLNLDIDTDEGVAKLFNPFYFKTNLNKTAKKYIIHYFKTNLPVLDIAMDKWPEEKQAIKALKESIEKWI